MIAKQVFIFEQVGSTSCPAVCRRNRILKMFHNIIRRSVQANIKNVSNYNLLRFSSVSGPKDDIKDALDIEANLFDNSLLQHQPVNTREALRKHKSTAQSFKQKKQPPKHAINNLAKNAVPKMAAPSVKGDSSRLIKDSELNLEFTRLTLQVNLSYR